LVQLIVACSILTPLSTHCPTKGFAYLPMYTVGVDMAKTIEGEQYLERGERG